MYCEILRMWFGQQNSSRVTLFVSLIPKKRQFSVSNFEKKGDRTVKFLISVVLRLLKVEVEKK